VVGRDVGASNFRKFRTGRQDAGSTGRHELCRVGVRGGTIGFGVGGACGWLVVYRDKVCSGWQWNGYVVVGFMV